MQTVDDAPNFIEGVFVKELKNRFLCEILVDGESTVCYVPSSCHLSNFLDLTNKKVLLVPTQTPNSHTKYALFAVPFKRSYLILNTSMANAAVVNSLRKPRFSYLGKRKTIFTEHRVDDYKTDVYIQDSKTIIEIKSIISTTNSGLFPTVYSERTIKQLQKLQELMLKGYKVAFIIVSLSPYLREVSIDNNTEFYKEFVTCIKQGMIAKAYTCRLSDDAILIEKEIPILLKQYEIGIGTANSCLL